MKVEIESYSPEVPQVIRDAIVQDVEQALQMIKTVDDGFIVNDTHWFMKNTKGKIRPAVVNSAKYITGNFQNNLLKFGWQKEAAIDGQTFDAYRVISEPLKLFALPEARYLSLLADMRASGGDAYGERASEIFKSFVKSTRPYLPDWLQSYRAAFTLSHGVYNFRVGLEFETGNIASSFRAIAKLSGLYHSGKIDVGVFITSKSKSDGAARIWPVSNRNGSFEELQNRNYDAYRSYPFIDISFRPDRYSENAPYFSPLGTYNMTFTGETRVIEGEEYLVAKDADGLEKLRPAEKTISMLLQPPS